MGYLKSTPYEILSRRRGRTHRNTPHEGKGARRERPNWGLALLMRPAKAAPAVPFANLPLCQRPNVCVSNHRGISGPVVPCKSSVPDLQQDILRLGLVTVKVLEAAPNVEHTNEVNSLGRLFRRGGCRLCVVDRNAPERVNS